MGGSQDRIRRALDQMLYLPHLKAQHAEPSLPVTAGPSGGSGGGSGQGAGRGRPWDRGDLFRRLATFKSSTWFCKPHSISPVECARRGWTNAGPDMLSCEFCKAKVSCPIAAELTPEEAAAAGEAHAARLSSAHDAVCPWRTATSALSLLQFPPLTEDAVRQGFKARRGSLQRLVCMPPVSAEALDTLVDAAGPHRLAQLMQGAPGGGQGPAAGQQGAGAALPAATPAGAVGEGVALLGSAAFDARARLLSLCGWDLKVMMASAGGSGSACSGDGANSSAGGPQQEGSAEGPAHVGPESAALQCSLCSATAGLWAFFPQCKPKVLPAPRRAGGAPGSSSTSARSAGTSSAAVAKSVVSRNVAADIGTTIAGGAMQPAAGQAAAPFGAGAQQAAAFGLPAGAPGGAAPEPVAAVPGSSERPPSGAAAPAAAAAAAGPFGSAAPSSGLPVFGFAALHSQRPAADQAGAAAGTAREGNAVGGASIKRKQPDFSWTAVLADIDAKAAAEKRSKGAARGVLGHTAQAGAPAPANGDGGSSRAGAGVAQQASAQQQRAAVAAAASKYGAAQAQPLDPLALHRSFCPWVNGTQAGEKDGRCGWRWCLQQLSAAPTAAEAATAADNAVEDGEEDGEGGGGGSGRDWDPAKLLRQVLQQVDVHK